MAETYTCTAEERRFLDLARESCMHSAEAFFEGAVIQLDWVAIDHPTGHVIAEAFDNAMQSPPHDSD